MHLETLSLPSGPPLSSTTEPAKISPTKTKRTTSMESDTDYGSGSSRSSSLETTPSTKQENKYPLDRVPIGRSRERTSESYVTKSSTLERPYKTSLTSSYDYRREKHSESVTAAALRSQTLGRKSALDSTSYSSSRLASSTLDRKRPPSSRIASSDVTSLNPATLKSLEKLERIKRRDHHRPLTPEPESPSVTQIKMLQLPERQSRRKSEGNHPIGHLIGHLTCTPSTLPEEPDLSGGKDTNTVESTREANIPQANEKPDAIKKTPNIVVETAIEDTSTGDLKAGSKDVVVKDSVTTDSKETVVEEVSNKTADYKATGKDDSIKDNSPNETKDSVRTKEIGRKEGLSRTMSQPPKSSDDRRSKYKSSTDNVYTLVSRSPIESAWGSFRSEKTTPLIRAKTKDDHSWRVTPTSDSPRSTQRKYDSPNTSRSNTPTSPPLRKPDEVKCEDSLGSRSSTPTSPLVKDTGKPLREGRSSPKITYTSVKIEERVTSPTTKATVVKETSEQIPIASESPKVIVHRSTSPTPPHSTEVKIRTRLTTSPARDHRRPKSRDSEAMRAMKIEQRKTPVLTLEALEALDSMLKCGTTNDNDALETCVEEEEEVLPKKTSILKLEPTVETPKKKVALDSKPLVVNEPAMPSAVRKVQLEDRRQTKSASTLGDERDSLPVCPEAGETPSDTFSLSMNSGLSPLSSKGRFRHSFSGGMSTSLSMTDLSQIGKKESKARRVGRSNSKRLIGRSAIDSYVSDNRTSPSRRGSGSGSISVTNLQSSSSSTLPAKMLSGRGIDYKEKKTEKTEKRFRLFK